MGVQPKTQRNEEIINDARLGMTIKQLEVKYELTTSRVRAIIGKKVKGYRVKNGRIVL